MIDPRNARAAVFEVKHAKTLEKMESNCQEAIRQIADKMYAREFEDNYDEVLCFGIAFFKKRCLVKKK